MKILVTMPVGEVRESFLPLQVRERLESVAEVEYNTMERNFTPEELKERLRGKDIALTGWGTGLFDETVLEGNDTLRLIAHTGGSVTPVMSDEAYERGIRVISGNEMYAESVAESVIAYALASLRRIPEFIDRTRSGDWYHAGEVWEGLLDQTVGVIGFGMTSRHLFRMGKAFRLKFPCFPPDGSARRQCPPYCGIPWGSRRSTMTCRMDRNFAPLTNVMTWMDQRAAAEADELCAAIGTEELYRASGWKPDHGDRRVRTVMNFLVDTANLEDIRFCNTYFPVIGVTTNPTLIAREKVADPVAHILAIREIIGPDKQLHVQLTETGFEEMLEEAGAVVAAAGKNTFLKVPVSPVGLQVTAALSEQGIGVTETAILSVGQAVLAARAGARYAADPASIGRIQRCALQP